MSEVVFVLGAGASQRAGAPMMNDFLDTAERLLRARQCGGDEAAFELVFKAVAALQAVYAKAVIDSNNLEAVFAAFEMAKLFGQMETLTAPELELLPGAIRRVIVRTLEETIKFPVATGGGGVLAPPPYDEFCGLLRFLASQGQPRTTASVLTFNYDLALDFGLYRQSVVVNYGLDALDATGGIDLLKLHGSLNWVKCQGCGTLTAWKMSEFFERFTFRDAVAPGATSTRLDVGQRLTRFVHCGETAAVAAEPVIVPPTWSKTSHYEAIAPVWKRAAIHLSEARDIVVIGYSLPDTDEFFRYLYALGTVSNQRLRRFWVIDPDQSGRVRQRFEGLLGPLARSRFRVFPSAFEQEVGALHTTFVSEFSS